MAEDFKLTEKDKEIIRRLSEKGKIGVKKRQDRLGKRAKKRPRLAKPATNEQFEAKVPKNAREKGRNAIIIEKNTRALKRAKEKNPFTRLGGKI